VWPKRNLWIFVIMVNLRNIKVYVAGKYSGDVEKNIEKAAQVSAKLWDIGFTVICPHMNTANFEHRCKITGWEDFLEGDLVLLKDCNMLVVLDDWEESKGARKEVKAAKEWGIPIYSERLERVDDV